MIIITNTDHPLKKFFPELKQITINEINNIKINDDVLDLTLLPTECKKHYIHDIKKQGAKKIYLESSINALFNFPDVAGYHSMGFWSPSSTYETYNMNFSLPKEIKTKNHSTQPDFFYYPRVLSTIINEAYFYLEEGLGKKEDIDTAMKYGLNFPLGPIEWSKKIGLKYICYLLDELFTMTRDSRYGASLELRKNL